MSEHARLRNCRPDYAATISRYSDGRPAEIFPRAQCVRGIQRTRYPRCMKTDRAPTSPPVFVVSFRCLPGVGNPTLALRSLLKIALRRFGLRCVRISEERRQ